MGYLYGVFILLVIAAIIQFYRGRRWSGLTLAAIGVVAVIFLFSTTNSPPLVH